MEKVNRRIKRFIRSPFFLAILGSVVMGMAVRYQIEELRWVASGIGAYAVYRGVFK